jgi:hypothetical protein
MSISEWGVMASRWLMPSPLPFVRSLWLTRRSAVSPIHKIKGWICTHDCSSTLERSRCNTTNLPASLLPTPSGMATPVHAMQVSAGGYPHAYDHDRSSPPPTPLSETLVEAPRSDERPSIELKISGSGASILNAIVVDPAGRPLYSISSNESRTTLLSQRDSSKVATIDWDHSSPRMVFRGKKVKCKEWLPRAGPDTE